MYTLKNDGASTDPWGRPFFKIRFRLTWLPRNTRKFRWLIRLTYYISVGCNKHFCFKPLAHRSVKLTFSTRSLKAVVRSPCQAVTMTLTTDVRMCVYINEYYVTL